MQDQPDAVIAISFYNTHDIITRGLKVSIESLQGVSRNGFQKESDQSGLFNYLRALGAVLHAHHRTEDDIAFPYFRDILPDAPFDTLTSHHRVMVPILTRILELVEKYDGSGQVTPDWRTLEIALVRLDKIWIPHIQIETDTIITKADALLPLEERLRLVKQFAEYGQKLALPPFLTVPFMIYNLSEEERKIFIQGMPDEVVQTLVPVVWKEQWESMKPYLLS